ncbi:MAG TPA: polymer-forming cytoskeletal protein [Candidatus Saccharimonadales bacterium]|nr:polymer-forming cytoskeletal protein [Candidatus Saccharimonadales bacterium]HSX46746.1 polymer-forming cytoskeletal protein [Patescibacteria group bacterium]
MGRFRKLITTTGVLVVTLLAVGGLAYGATNQTTAAGTSDHSVYKFGQTVNITGTIKGDVFCAGQTVTVDATVEGDVLCAGQTVTVRGKVNGNVRLAGQTLNLSAEVAKNGTLTGQMANVDKRTTVGGDLTLAAGQASVGGQIGRDLNARSEDLLLQSTSKVGRDLNYTAQATARLEVGAVVSGQQLHNYPSRAQRSSSWHGFALVWRMYWLFAAIFFAFVLVLLFPNLFRRWNQVAVDSLGTVLLTGFLSMFVIPVLAVSLFITVIGIPLGLFLLLLWAGLWVVSWPLAAYYLGSMVLARAKNALLVVLAGSVIISLLGFVPIVGWIFAMLMYWVGMGIALVNLKRLYRKPKYNSESPS